MGDPRNLPIRQILRNSNIKKAFSRASYYSCQTLLLFLTIQCSKLLIHIILHYKLNNLNKALPFCFDILSMRIEFNC